MSDSEVTVIDKAKTIQKWTINHSPKDPLEAAQTNANRQSSTVCD